MINHKAMVKNHQMQEIKVERTSLAKMELTMKKAKKDSIKKTGIKMVPPEIKLIL